MALPPKPTIIPPPAELPTRGEDPVTFSNNINALVAWYPVQTNNMQLTVDFVDAALDFVTEEADRAESGASEVEAARLEVAANTAEVAANTATVVSRADQVADDRLAVAEDRAQVSQDAQDVADMLDSIADGPVASVAGLTGVVTADQLNLAMLAHSQATALSF